MAKVTCHVDHRRWILLLGCGVSHRVADRSDRSEPDHSWRTVEHTQVLRRFWNDSGCGGGQVKIDLRHAAQGTSAQPPTGTLLGDHFPAVERRQTGYHVS